MKIKVKRNHPLAILPTYGTEGAACFDLYIAEGEWPAYDTGLAFDIPKGHYMEVHVRSSIGIKQDVRLKNGTGIIDSDYRGNVKLFFTGTQTNFKVGARVAQGIIKRYSKCSFQEVDEITETKRGTRGIGSTGQ